MGLKDTAAKNFFGRPDVMANLLDYVLYGGQTTVQASQLRELSGEHYRIEQDESGKFKTDNRFRDKLFEYDTGDGKLAVGFEYQSKDDKRMLLRIMGYDHKRNNEMFASGQRSRIINIVLCFDRKKQHPPATSLEKMFGAAPPIAAKYCPDYGYIGLNIYDLAEKSERFSCKELKEVLNYFKNDQDREQLVKAITEGLLKGCLSRDAALVCAVFMDLKMDIDNEAEEIDMCKAIRDLKRESKKLGREEGLAEGLEKGREEGFEEGKASALKEYIERLLGMRYSLPAICLLTGASEETVKEVTLSLLPQT